jgi:hypothetical protein
MHLSSIPFGTTDWSSVAPTEHRGERGMLCLEGELHTELQDGRVFTLRPGMSYQVADDAEPHRSYTRVGARLFIVD